MVNATLRCAGASDPGRVRQNNEDRLHVDIERGIFLVVDGIGGQAAGEKAAEIAVERVRARLERQTGTAEQRISEAVAMANNEILETARAHPEWSGMACVLTVAVLENGSAVVGHVGDSRLYKIRRGEIQKITHDHSPVGEREDRHELTEAEAMRHPRRNEVFRDVGSEEHAPGDPDFVELQRIPFEPDSALLLCSDGLSDQVGSNDIRRAVERNAGNAEAAVKELIEAANRAGGKDNVTAIVIEGEQFTAPPAAEDVRSASLLLSRPALFLYGVLLALAAAWLSRGYWQPAPVVLEPQILTAGTGAPFPTIMDAMARARAGDTIEVVGGEYREALRLKSGVTLRSRVPREVILRSTPVGSGPAVLADDVRDARIIGFRILADAQMPLSAGIVLINSEVAVEDVEVAGADVGIEIRGDAAPQLRANAIHDCGQGVLISGTAATWLSHNSIQRNVRTGIAAQPGAHPSLVGNVFEKNPVDLPGTDMKAVREMNFFLEPPAGARPARSPREGRKK